MRATVAKKIRRLVFGTDLSTRARKYFHHPKRTGTMIADERRQRYQGLKRAYSKGLFAF